MKRGHDPERTCIVTRQQLPADGMVRFVMAPDGSVVPDLRRRLPGRGVWVTARADVVETAERKHMFRRGFASEVSVEPGLAGRVSELLRKAAVSALSMARKAGTAVSGFGKVEAALGTGTAVAVIHAPDASDDGVAKIAGVTRRHYSEDQRPRVVRAFTNDDLDLAFGRTHVIHAALLAGPASENVMRRVQGLADFVGGDGSVGGSRVEPA